MTRDEAKQLLPLIKAYSEGKTIQAIALNETKENWIDVKNVDIHEFDFNRYEYRIKPESTYRPFKDAEECWNEMQKHQPFGWVKESSWTMKNSHYYQIIEIGKSSVCLHEADIVVSWNNYEHMINSYTFADGEPFGVKEESV